MKFESAIDHILRYEGVESNDPLDRGGHTKYGIADTRDGLKDGMADLDGDERPDIAMQDLTIDQAKAIYKKDYWDRMRCDELPPLLRVAVFDAAVNHGVGNATRMLQRAAGVKDDGWIGPVTIAAVDRSDREVETWIKFMAERASAYARNAQFNTYGRGWMRRLMDVAYTSLRRT